VTDHYEIRQIGPNICNSAPCASLEEACEAYRLRLPRLAPGDRLQIERVTIFPNGVKLSSVLLDAEIASVSPGYPDVSREGLHILKEGP
jgi:hypothetical protein